MKDSALTQLRTVILRMSAWNVAIMPTQVQSASSKLPNIDHWAHQPCYVWDLVWTDNEPIHMTLAA
jgi:hypothetical protein